MLKDLHFLNCKKHSIVYPTGQSCPACRAEEKRRPERCNLRECDAGDPYLAKRGGPRFPESPCCHQHIIKGKTFCIS